MGKRFICFACIALISGCGASLETTSSSEEVKVSSILVALKCAFAEALVNEHRNGTPERLRGRVAAGKLTLNIVASSSNQVSAAATNAPDGPFVFSYRGGTGSILPSFSRSRETTNTVKTVIDFRYLLEAKDTQACSLQSDQARNSYGFSKWLASTISGLDIAAPLEPRGQVDKIEYSADFAVKSESANKVDFSVIFLSASAGTVQSRNDVQSLTFTIAPADPKTNPRPGDGGVGLGGIGPAIGGMGPAIIMPPAVLE